jgi:transposase
MARRKSKPQLSLQSAHLYDDGAGIPAGHWSRLFFEHVYSAFRDEEFAELYKEKGRYPVSPSLLASVTVLQYMHRVSDRVAVDNTIMRRDWRIALGITPDYEGFHPTVLCSFRGRLLANDQRRKIFEKVLAQVQKLGLIKRHHRVRVDATELIANVSVLSRAESLMEAMRIVVSDLYGLRPRLRRRVDFLSLYERYGQEVWLGKGCDGPQKLTDLALDAQRLIRLCGPYRPRGYEVLVQMLQENFSFAEPEQPVPLEPEERPPDHIVTPHEPDVRVGKKGSKVWMGDKVHVVESVQLGEKGILLDVMVTPPQAEDSTTFPALALRIAARSPQIDTILADGGYSAAGNSRLADRLGLDLVSPPRRSNRHMTIPIEEFHIDLDNCFAICPEAHRSSVWTCSARTLRIRFDPRDCAACPRRSQCTTSPQGRSLSPSLYYRELLRERVRFQKPETANLYKQRAGVEATISELVHCCGLRRSRYRGAPKRALHALLAGAALNVRRLLHHLAQGQQTMEPLTDIFSLLSGDISHAPRRLQPAL